MTKIRVQATNLLGQKFYIRELNNEWRCFTPNGTVVPFSHAGFLSDEMQMRFVLEDCEDAEAVLAACNTLGSTAIKYELI